jgi:cyclase
VAWAREAAERGAGELVVTSIDREGTGSGFDLELTRQIATAVSIPVIACGGAGRVEHVGEAVLDGCADAVGLASLLHYEAFPRLGATDEHFREEGNVEFLQGRRGARAFGRVTPVSLREVKEHLSARGIDVRPA